jgi:agmatinase
MNRFNVRLMRLKRIQADEVEKDLEAIAAEVAMVLKKNGLPVILGGEHTVTLGALKAIVDSNKKIGVVQFDAHADLRDSYEDNRLSHACVR